MATQTLDRQQQDHYDGDWDAYIDDFATKIPDFLQFLATIG